MRRSLVFQTFDRSPSKMADLGTQKVATNERFTASLILPSTEQGEACLRLFSAISPSPQNQVMHQQYTGL